MPKNSSSLRTRYLEWERTVSDFFKDKSITLVRYSIGFIFFWYGLQKVLGISPAEDLVYKGTPWGESKFFLNFVGCWEMILGIFLLIKPTMRIGLIMLFLQFPGTFLPLFLYPKECFTVFPYGLTLEGQYIFKNLILISAALVLVASLHPRRRN